MNILLRTISLVAIPLCSSAQVTVLEADIAPRIGDRLEYVLQSFEGPLSESVGDIGMMGGPLVVDVRDGMGDPLFSFASTTQILLPQDAPGSEKYPEAEYVVRATDIGQDHEPTYAFFVGLGGEARLLGIEGLSDEIVDVQAASDQGGFPDQYPLEFDKQFTPIEVPLNNLVPELEVTGSLTMTGSVDAWGTVQVPAGSFEALRMHVRGEGEFGISVAGETIILRQVIDQYTWIAPRWAPSPTSK